MPVYLLDEDHGFPDPRKAGSDGLLAIGGDLHPFRLINAYATGVFPWFDENSPILWWSPDPRLVLYPHAFKCSKSLRQTVRNAPYHFSADTDFEHVIMLCAGIDRQDGAGTWITQEMIDAYSGLHRMGIAHSVETWYGDELVGGLYGISLGKAFFGESMFFRRRDASKAALWQLCAFLAHQGFHFIDAQMETDHLKSLGAVDFPRNVFLKMLRKAMEFPTLQESWSQSFNGFLLETGMPFKKESHQ